jgi:transposase
MARYIEGTDRCQPMLLPPAVDDYISPASPVRAIDAFVDSLDHSGMGFKTRRDGSEGRSSYDPGTLLKLYLWGYLKRTRSSRGLENACAENLQAIWLTRNLRPDHSTISDFRKNHADAIKGILREFNLVCLELKLFGKELVAIDGTFIKAVNSPARSFTTAKITKLIETIDSAIKRYLDALQQADQDNPPADGGSPSGKDEVDELQRKLAKIREKKVKLEDYRVRCETSPTGQVNLTDPDCRQLRKNGKSTVGYNVQTVVDSRHHLIATVEVTQDPNDHQLLDPMAQQAKAALDLPADAPLKALADSGYGSGPQHAACEAHGTIALAPLRKNKSDGNGLYKNDQFIRDPGSDSYTCPQGQTLPRRADTKSRHDEAGYHTYHNSTACKGCPVRAQCTASPFRKLLISVHEPVIARARERLSADPNAMRERASLVEHPFGTIKERHGYTGLLCRGIKLAGAEMGLSAWAYNFTRVLNLVGVEQLIRAICQNATPQAC